MRFVLLILLVSCLSFFSYGKELIRYRKYIPIIQNGIPRLHLHISSRPPGFQLYKWQQHTSTSGIIFQNINVKT
jgi:hypothetical protein